MKKCKKMRILLGGVLLYLIILGAFTLGTMLILNQNQKEQYWWQKKEVRYE